MTPSAMRTLVAALGILLSVSAVARPVSYTGGWTLLQTVNKAPDARKRGPLLADSHMMPGKVAVRPAITAPAPTVISSAGKAQHSSVEVLANNDSVGPIRVRRSIGFIPPEPRRHVE